MKRLYAARREALVAALRDIAGDRFAVHAEGGLSVRLALADDADDQAIAAKALRVGLAPVALSPWFVTARPRRGLLLGVTNLEARRLAADCVRLADLVGGRSAGL